MAYNQEIWDEAKKECFIVLIKRDNFDYIIWQREYFDKMKPGEFAVNASEYAECHPYMGKGEVL